MLIKSKPSIQTPFHILIKKEMHFSSKLLPNQQGRRGTDNKDMCPEGKGSPGAHLRATAPGTEGGAPPTVWLPGRLYLPSTK